jgi:hypothetical protein
MGGVSIIYHILSNLQVKQVLKLVLLLDTQEGRKRGFYENPIPPSAQAPFSLKKGSELKQFVDTRLPGIGWTALRYRKIHSTLLI